MASRAELFVRELSDGEAAHLLQLSKRGSNAVVRHRATLLFASFQGQSVSQIALLFAASATHVAALIHRSTRRASPPWTLTGARAVHAGSISTSARRS